MAGLGLVARKVRRRNGLTRPGRRPAAPDFINQPEAPLDIHRGINAVSEAFNSVLEAEYVHCAQHAPWLVGTGATGRTAVKYWNS